MCQKTPIYRSLLRLKRPPPPRGPRSTLGRYTNYSYRYPAATPSLFSESEVQTRASLELGGSKPESLLSELERGTLGVYIGQDVPRSKFTATIPVTWLILPH